MTDRLESQLRELGEHLDTGPAPDVATQVVRRLRTEPAPLAIRARRRLVTLVAALLTAVLTAGLLAVPAVRAAVGELLSLPGVVFDRDEPLPPKRPAPPGALGAAYQLTGRVTLADARRLAPGRTLVPAGVGDPDEVYVTGKDADVAVHLLWAARSGESALPGSRAGLYVTVFGAQADAYLQKMIRGVDSEEVTVDSRPAVWISEEHGTLQFGRDGLPDFSTSRRAGPTLLVDRGGMTLRIEADRPKAAMIDLATSAR